MWNNIIQHFQTLEQRPLERMAILVGGLLFFWILEGAIPLVSLHYKKNKLRHAGVMTVIIAVLALDFSSWLVHLIMHKNKFLWRFHLIHHSDTNVDVTTGLRHHPGDSLLRGIFFMLLILVSGAPMYSVMIYQTLVVLATAFTHANISLPKGVDKAISYLLISPNMHKVHHHWKQPYTDSTKDLRYGLDRYFPEEKDEDIVTLLVKPFQKQDE